MADLTSKLAGSIQKSMSGFGAGIKGAFMSANPAGFGLAMKGIQSVMASQVTMQKRDFAQRQQDRQFAEENANEQKKVTSDMLGTLHSIDNTLKRMLALSLNNVNKDKVEDSPLKKLLNAVLPAATAGAGAAKAADALADGKKTKTFFDTLGDIFKGLKESLLAAFKYLIKFFTELPGLLMTGIKNLIKFFKELPDNLMAGLKNLIKFFKELPVNVIEGFKNLIKFFTELPGRLFKSFSAIFPETTKAIAKFVDDFKKFFRIEEIGAFLAEKFAKLREALKLDDIFLFFKELPGKIFTAFSELFPETSKTIGKFIEDFKKVLRVDEIGAFFDEKISKLKDFFKFEAIGAFFDEKISKLKDFFKFEAIGDFFDEKISKLKDFFKFEAIGDFFDEKISKLKDFFKFDEVAGLFDEKINSFKNLFKTFGELVDSATLFVKESAIGKLVTSFFGIFSGIFKDVTPMLESAKVYITKSFDDIIGWIKNIFGMGGEGAGIFERLAVQFPQLTKALKSFGKLIPFLDLIIFAVEGLFSAFDTKQIKKDLNVREVTIKDRAAAFIGGGVASFTGGLIDVGQQISDWVFNTDYVKQTKDEGKGTYQQRATTAVTRYFRDLGAYLGDYWSAIGNVMSGDFAAAKEDIKHASMLDEAMDIRVRNFLGEVGVDISNYFGQLGVDMSNAFGKLVNGISNYIKGSETLGKIYDSVSSTITVVQNFVGKLFFDIGNIIDSALLSTRKKVAELADKFIPDIAKTDSIKKFISETKAEAEAPKKVYKEYVAQKFSQNYQKTEFIPKTFQKDTYTPMANPAQGKLDAERATVNDNYDESTRLANKAIANKPKVDTAGASSSGASSSLTPYVVSPVSPDYSGQLSNLTPQQTAMAEKIYKGFIGAGFSDIQAQAAVVNAYAESRLNPNAGNVSSKEASFGLFQINTAGGLGKGYSSEYLKNPDNNIALIIREAKGEFGFGEGFRRSTTLSDATKYFTTEIERPASPYQTGENRAAMAKNSASVLAQLSKASSSSAGGNYSNYGNERRNSNVNSPSDAPTGRKDDPVIVAQLSKASGGNYFNYGNEESNSNVNSPSDAPTGRKDDPVIVAQGAMDPVQKAIQDEVTKANIQTPVLSQAQLDEMKAQQVYREKVDAENKKYRNERDGLEKQFRQTLENNYRNMLTAAIPMGVTGTAATTNAGGNIANKFLAEPMNNLATQIFGKEAGRGIGSIFTQLAGSYGNQLVGSVLAPVLGMSSDQMNRSLNNFASGNEGMGWSDLLYGMTGISTDLRSAFGYEQGINNFSKSLAGITSKPFSPLFNMGSTSGVSAAEVSATNAGIINQNAATQNAQIQVAGATAAAQEFVYGVGEAGRNFNANVSGSGSGAGGSGGGILGTIFGALTGSGASGTDLAGWGSRDAGGIMSSAPGGGGGGDSFLGRIGNMITGGKGGAAAGGDFLSNLGGKFIGNALGVKTDSLSGVYAQTGINAIIKNLITSGGVGLEQTIARLAPGALLQRGVIGLGNMIGGASGTVIGDIGLGLSSPGLSAYGNVMDAFAGSNAAIQAGSVLGAVGAGMGAMSISGALSGGYTLDGDMKGVADIATFIGGLTPLGPIGAGLIGAAVNRLFGRSAPYLTNIGIEGTLGASKEAGGSGTSLQGYKNMREKGGMYSSDRNTRTNFGVDPKVAEALMKDVDDNLANMKKATTILGLTTSQKFEDFTQSIQLEFFEKSIEEQNQMLLDTLKTFNNGMLTSVFPIFERFKLEGEDSIGAMNRLATSYSIAGTASKMLGYGDTFGLGVGAIAGDYANSMLPTGFNVEALRAQGIASGKVTNADFYGTYQQLVSAAVGAVAPSSRAITDDDYITTGFGKGASRQLRPGLNIRYSGFGKGGGTNPYIYNPGTAAQAAVYKTVAYGEGDELNVQLANNTDAILRAEQADKLITDFGGKEAYQKYMTDYFNKFYTDKEKVALNLKLAKEELDRIAKDTGLGAELTDVTKDTKLQEKKDAYRKIKDEAYATYLANPTEANRLRYVKLTKEAVAYEESVSKSISAQKYQDKPGDAATKNASLSSSLADLKAPVSGAAVSSASLAGSTNFGTASLTGYTASRNVVKAMGGTGTNNITVIPVSGGTVSGGNSTSAISGGGTLFSPTTYVDNSSVTSTNINGGSGSDNVRDTYSHPIIGSTERSVSSTFGYNYLYR